MARSSPVVLILGHSFVRRLCHDLETGFEQRADLNFNLKGTAVVFMHGVGGRTVPKLRMFDLHVVKQLSPDIIIVEIGTNDLTRVGPEVIMPPKRANSASTVAAPARKRSRRVKSSQGSAGFVQQTQPQKVLAEVFPQFLVEQIVSRVSDEVTRRLSSTGGDQNANDHQIPDQVSDVPVTGDAAGADQISEVPAVGIPADSPGQSVIHGAVSQFQ
ncbi:unnamed protein product, partial [Porites lobata]